MTKNKYKKTLINIFLTSRKLKMEQNFQKLHTSVLLSELVDAIKISTHQKNIIVDATLGMGGHAREILKKMQKGDIFIGFDADIRNLNIIRPVLLKEFENSGIEMFFINDNFLYLKKYLDELNISEITGIYYDLGISSLHVDESQRGFSFKLEGPLDMRFDTSKGITASNILHSYKKEDLIGILRNYSEDPHARKIAEKIVEERKKGKRFYTTKDLSELIEKITQFPKTKNRIFQALRIEVNKELENIEISIRDALKMLTKGGIIFVISFHSLEDRIVKNILKQEEKDCICSELICVCKHKKTVKSITKKPIIPTDLEIKSNPRSRSAKARCSVKI